jgi:integrase/recombinase XerD
MTALRTRMIEDMKIRNLALNTQNAYLRQVSRFARHFHKSPDLLGPEDIRAYQLYLTEQKELSPVSIVVAVSALRFLYEVTLHRDWDLEEIIPAPKKPQKLPIILSPQEVLEFLSSIRLHNHRTILTCCYAAGLRISEALALQVSHIDSQRMVIRVEQGKRRKDRLWAGTHKRSSRPLPPRMWMTMRRLSISGICRRVNSARRTPVP